jgi:hypothetical protein
MSTTPLRSTAIEPDRLSIRISNWRTRMRAVDREIEELNIERLEIHRLQREALADEPRRAAADAPPARPRQTETTETDGVVIDGVSDPQGFAASALRAARMARGEKV